MHNLFFFIIFIIKTISYIVQAGLEFMALQFCLIIAGVTGVCYHTQPYTVSFIYLRFGFYFKLYMCGFVHMRYSGKGALYLMVLGLLVIAS